MDNIPAAPKGKLNCIYKSPSTAVNQFIAKRKKKLMFLGI